MRSGLRNLGLAITVSLTSCAFPARVFTGNLDATFRTPLPSSRHVSDPRAPNARLAATWIGHASVLLQMDDIFVMTDPVFTDSVGLFAARLISPGLRPDEVPDLEAVVISHMHYDHLSFGSLDSIEDRTPLLFVPTGGLSYMPNFRFDVIELAAHESRQTAGGLTITALPVHHTGWRYAIDTIYDPPSYTGYLLEYHGLRVYFGGDTAYGKEIFKGIDRRYGPINLAILPVAPMTPRPYMAEKHIDPDEALTAFEELGAEQMLAIHHSTFINSLDEPGAPQARLRAVADKRGIEASRIAILWPGERRIFVAQNQDTIGASTEDSNRDETGDNAKATDSVPATDRVQ